jgi:arsenite methyltransferase
MTAGRGAVEYLKEIDANRPELGEFYDELPLWSAPFGLLLLDCVPMKPGLTFLDVGAGTGFLTLELAQRCGPEAKVIAVDPWMVGMSRLRRKLDDLGLANVVLIEQDAAVLDLPEASIDVIVSNLGINNFENPGAVLKKCFRVAKPGAKLILTTNLTGHMSELYDVYRLAVLEAHISHRGTVDSVSSRLRDAGFEVGHVITQSFRMRFADGSSLLRHAFIRLGFVPGWKSVAAPDALETTFKALERNLNAFAAERGELGLTIPMACVEAWKPSSTSRSVID